MSKRSICFRLLGFALVSMIVLSFCAPGFAQNATNSTKPPLTLDEFFSYVEITGLALAPDGSSAVIDTERPAWKQNRFRNDLWMWHAKDNSLTLLATTGHDSSPRYSPDGRYVAFRSDRPIVQNGELEKNAPERVWVIPVAGGDAFPLYTQKLDVDAFTWSGDGTAIFFAVQQPITPDAQEAEKAVWKNTIRWRKQRRGDAVLRISIADALPQPKLLMASETAAKPNAGSTLPLPADATVVARSPLAMTEMAASPDGKTVAFESRSVLNRQENPADYEIFSFPADATNATPHQLTHNQAYESGLHWSWDSKTLYFSVPAASGSVEGPYEDVQGRLYAMNPETGTYKRLGADYGGNWAGYSVPSNGGLLGLGMTGIQTQMYRVGDTGSSATSKELHGVAGTYVELATARHTPRLLFVHSGIDEPGEVYMAQDAAHLAEAKPITHFNKLFTERALPRWKAFNWTSPDGTPVQGVLLYPPGKFGQKHLRMFTLIHGGPGDADGNRFGADWYDWAILAADKGWLVFRPNYRGSTGYGDKFELAYVPNIVSDPGKDILSGVDKLVADGIADPNHLAIGGYSYGGYMTNWLITQTDRFRSAVTGAGAVEHAANWGNDDMSYDDAHVLGGLPWQKPKQYQSQAALFRFDKVKTPVHDVIGGADIRVAALEGYLLERALQTEKIPHVLLVFPGEGHGLANDPWHGYIKVRDELKWLEKYDHASQ